jgi:hypothetical protein
MNLTRASTEKEVKELPKEFYLTKRKGWGYCRECKEYSINALYGKTLVCENGHKVILITREERKKLVTISARDKRSLK